MINLFESATKDCHKMRSLLPEDSRYGDAIDRFSGGVLFLIVRGQ